MSELARLAERRRQLVARAAAQRTAVAHAMESWRPLLALADQGIAALRSIGRHPAWLVGTLLLFAVWRPRGAGKWLRRGWMLWQVGRSLRKS